MGDFVADPLDEVFRLPAAGIGWRMAQNDSASRHGSSGASRLPAGISGDSRSNACRSRHQSRKNCTASRRGRIGWPPIST